MSATAAPKILYTSADVDGQGGALRCLFDMGGEISKWGYRPILALSKQAGELNGHGPLATCRLSLPRPRRGRSILSYLRDVVGTIRSARILAKLIREEGISLVHVNEILDVYGGIAARIAGVPCVWHIRADISGWPLPLRTLLPRIVSRLSSQIIAVSSSVREHVFEAHGIESPKVSVIHDPGPDPTTFRPGLDGTAFRHELGIRDDVGLVVLVAKMVEPKGHEVFIRAVPLVLASFPAAHFVLVGGDLDGDHHQRYAERMRQLPHELRVDHAVTFTGYRNDVASIMAAADVVAHCSTHPDPFPGVVLQGMALGKAVVASDMGGPREQIDDGLSGVLVSPRDPVALAGAISRLFEHPDLRASMGRAAAENVSSRFTSYAFYRQLSSSYERLIGGGH